jgi:phosphate transport system permease protein
VKKRNPDDAPRFRLSSSSPQEVGREKCASFASLDEAISAVEKSHFADDSLDRSRNVPSRVTISCGRSGDFEKIHGRPRYRFYLNTQTHGGGGEGTELSPWWGIDEAVAELKRLHKYEQIELKAGQRLELTHRDVFTATSFEKWKKRKETVAKYLLMLACLALILPVLSILGYIAYKAWPALSLSFLLENPKNYMTAGGIFAPLVGTFCIVCLSLLAAAPVGILAGVYLNEYARNNWFTRTINLAVVNLAGVPSIVIALFGVGAFVMFAGLGRSMLAASLTLAVMTVPVIITSTREALSAVPMAFREACWNLGATRWQTIRTIVLPNSISGILTGVILEVARAAGETAPILFTGAVFFMPELPTSPTDRFMALSVHLFTLVTQVRGAPEPLYYGTALVLIGLVLVVNSASIVLRSYLRAHKKW